MKTGYFIKLAVILFLLFQAAQLHSQDKISLEECYQLARENYPNFEKAGIWNEITLLNKANLQTSNFPQASLNAQATYQSDVTRIDIPVPNLNVPTVSNDQYKVYADIRQNIWDGGISRAGKELEDAILKNHLDELEVELYELNEQVAQAFFTLLAVRKQEQVLQAQHRILKGRLDVIESAIRNQVTEKTAALPVRAEILNLEQNELELKAAKEVALKMLSLLTGKMLTKNTEFIFDESNNLDSSPGLRPEYDLFNSQRAKLQVQANLLERQHMPKIFGFGQLGYGRPGLNMLNDEFDTYYLAGVGLSWNPFDWNNTSRQKQVLRLREQMIRQQEKTFTRNLDMVLARQAEQIEKLQEMLDKDRQLVDLRTEISKAAFSKFENGTMNSAEYIRELQTETIAKINQELHRIQLLEAREKYRILKGTAFSSKSLLQTK